MPSLLFYKNIFLTFDCNCFNAFIMRVFLFLLVFQFSFAQTTTEKWNSVQNRYETFDSSGNMISYKVWNSVQRQWETYNVNNQNTGYVPNKKRTDDNFELLKYVMEKKEAQYNGRINNNQRVSKYNRNVDIINTRIKILYGVIDNLRKENNLSDERYRAMIDKFNELYVDALNNRNYDYSDDRTTADVIEWLDKGAYSIGTEK